MGQVVEELQSLRRGGGSTPAGGGHTPAATGVVVKMAKAASLMKLKKLGRAKVDLDTFRCW